MPAVQFVACAFLTELSQLSSAASKSLKALTVIIDTAHIYIKESFSGSSRQF
jgi:hypothetical protein